MPISTPESMLSFYNGDKDHFQHVLEHLFFPAIEKAGLKPVAPVAKGADVIHAEIIRNLESSDLVLCDMSSLNANVFFELGIRTALAKPVCVVKDDSTPRVPFDMTVVNYHTYLSALQPWTLAKEIDAIAEHIKHSRERSQGTNMLWRYFSMSQRAELSISKDPTNERLELVMSQIEGLSSKIDFLENNSLLPPAILNPRRFDIIVFEIPDDKKDYLMKSLREFVSPVALDRIWKQKGKVPFRLMKEASENQAKLVFKILEAAGARASMSVTGLSQGTHQ